MRNITSSLFVIIAIELLLVPISRCLAHDLDYVAEHLIESNMNARYLAFPDIETAGTQTQSRLQMGYADIQTGPLRSTTVLLGWQWTEPQTNSSWSWIAGGFADYLQFTGDNGPALLRPIFTDAAPFTRTLPITINNVDGDAIHAGLSLALAQRPSSTWAWQAGLALEYYNVRRLAVAFTTTDLNPNFAGEIDYGAHYNSITPYYGATWFLPSDWAKFIWSDTLFSAHFIVATPGPHRGVYGHVSGPDFSYAGDSDQAGHGKHIPDGYSGFGLSIESASSHWRVDLGATLYFLMTENHIKRGSEPRFYLTWSLPMF